MRLARVVGTVVSTINVPVYDGRKLLLCDLLGPEGEPAGGYQIAVDVVDAGVGETVLLLDEGNSARQVLGAKDAPVRTLVVGIVDEVHLAPTAEERRRSRRAERAPTPRAARARRSRTPRAGKARAS